MTIALSTHKLQVGYRKNHPILTDVNLQIESGSFTAIIGANGCGKSTLLLALARQLAYRGKVCLGGQDAASLTAKQYARELAFLPQNPLAPEGVRVRSLVERGRDPYRRAFLPLTLADHSAVDAALARLDLDQMDEQLLSSISGGQRQRVWLAMTLAQQTEIILLDEPTAFLDLAYQACLLNICRSLAREGKTVLAVLHDLNLAAAFANKIIVIHQGGVYVQGNPQQCFTQPVLAEAFGLEAETILHPDTAVPLVLPTVH